ncbi:helix-turn-helix domain-containing protein [Streptomyces fuscigenes]|uniref:helix-turn-helix domain-containing protein n=1 Tax=Streptomyces fuscigenes TaxID=1528880 RepID=UPI001F345349|nr:helix-turn-helix transcriptional regulator [Streptomyces fuscigenes]MCF3962723.1 helix-turn-helix domain-containing protein [Streptomyces fuscigenes]
MAPASEAEPSILDFPHRPEWGSAVHRLAVGAHFRRCRKRAALAAGPVAARLRTTTATLSRMERGLAPLEEADLERLIDLYGVDDERERTRLRELAAESRKPEVWQTYREPVARWARQLIAVEPAAQRILAYEPHLVPGWLQTDEYARTVLRAHYPTASPDSIAERARQRTARLGMLRRANDPPVLLAVMDESVLTRPVGGPGVMYRQIEHLVRLLEELPYTLKIQIAPLSAGAVGAISHPIVHLRFSSSVLPDLVHLEQAGSAQYIEKRESTERYLGVLNNLCGASAPFDRTPALLREHLDRHR